MRCWVNDDRVPLIQPTSLRLDGGVRTGVITELCGNPGSGKSNLWFVSVPIRLHLNVSYVQLALSCAYQCR